MYFFRNPKAVNRIWRMRMSTDFIRVCQAGGVVVGALVVVVGVVNAFGAMFD